MSRSKAPIFIGTAAVGGLGYYLYSAGGDPKVAKKQAEGKSLLPSQFRRVVGC